MEQQPPLAGIGSACYIILKDDLQPDGMTPKEGKEWTKLDAVPQTKIASDASATDAHHESCGFKQSWDLSFDVKHKPNHRIQNRVRFSEENLQDCERLLRTWRPRLIARKKLLRAGIRLSRDVLLWLSEQKPSIDRTMGIHVVSYHIIRLRLLLGKKVWVADAINQESKHIYAIYSRLHRRKVVGVCAKHKGNKAI